ncbi:TIGR04282 family arsenosugar biosynthesis glycosyltransferase [Hirschia litorea]|uniref:DUF2064 domain-containing protein n=1 Tax=Hirschia litorea TaxID=1199156 RepID=A0ABW2IJL9_9PROT
MKPNLLIFAKPPRIGSAKTRLARDIGSTHAQRINRFCHSQIMRAASQGYWNTTICVAPDLALQTHHGHLWPTTFNRMPQGKGNLGERLAHAFATAPVGPVIVVGTDAPDIKAIHIHTAIKHLNGHDAVFGPADDGGFWLFGVSQALRRHPLPFNPVRWSSPHALADMQASLPPNTKTKLMHTMIDLDDAKALKAWLSDKQANSTPPLIFKKNT